MAALVSMATTRADVVYVDYQMPLNAPANDPGGLYLNVVTGVTGDTADTVPGWDVQIAQLNQGDAYQKIVFTNLRSGPGAGCGYEGASDNAPLNLAPVTYVGPNSTFYTMCHSPLYWSIFRAHPPVIAADQVSDR